MVAQRARIVPSATTSPACILCLGQIDLSIWIVINPHTTSATRFRTLCNVTRKLVRWRLGFHEQRQYYIGISSLVGKDLELDAVSRQFEPNHTAGFVLSVAGG